MNPEILVQKYCIEKCVKWIVDHNFTKVGLEFPDHPEIAPEMSQLIKAEVGFSPYILQDTNRSCGDCCIDERTALPRNIEAVIHFGRTCLTPTEALPVLYVLKAPQKINLAKILALLQGEAGPNCDERLILVYDVLYDHMIGNLSADLKSKFKNIVITRLIIPPKAKIVQTPSDATESGGEIITPFNSLVIKDDVQLIKTAAFNVREVDLPINCDINDYNFIFIGPKGPCLTALQLRFSDKLFYQVDASGESLTVTDFTKTVMSRSRKIEQIKEAKIIGILFTFINGHSEIVSRLRTLIKSAGKRSYTFFMGKINEPKLGNIVGVDAFVYVACPESSLFDRNDNTYIYQKVVAPWEVEVALNPSFNWSLNFETNFREFLSEEWKEDTKRIDETRHTVNDTVSNALVAKSKGILCELHQSGAGEVLQSLSWQGLAMTGEPTPAVGTVVEGRRGIASAYNTELNPEKG